MLCVSAPPHIGGAEDGLGRKCTLVPGALVFARIDRDRDGGGSREAGWSTRCQRGCDESHATMFAQEAYLDKGVPFRQSTLWAESDEPGSAGKPVN